MKELHYFRQEEEVQQTWAEKSGFLSFLSQVPKEVDTFNKTFGFNIRYIVTPPKEIDGSRDRIAEVGFVLLRTNTLMGSRQYCFYCLLDGNGALQGYTGIYKDGAITTISPKGAVKDYKNSSLVFYDWLRELVKASCNKY